MRPVVIFALGALVGIIVTVLLYTLDPTFQDGEGQATGGGGNARLSLDEESLGNLLAVELSTLPAFALGTVVNVEVNANGLVTVTMTAGVRGVAPQGRVDLNPDIEAGQLRVNVASSDLGGLAEAGDVAQMLERPLRESLLAVAGGGSYRLASITTKAERLTIEVHVGR